MRLGAGAWAALPGQSHDGVARCRGPSDVAAAVSPSPGAGRLARKRYRPGRPRPWARGLGPAALAPGVPAAPSGTPFLAPGEASGGSRGPNRGSNERSLKNGGKQPVLADGVSYKAASTGIAPMFTDVSVMPTTQGLVRRRGAVFVQACPLKFFPVPPILRGRLGGTQMSRSISKLTSAHVNRIREDRSGKYVGMHADGGGLYLQVTPTGGKSWLYCYMLNGRNREMGLGPLHSVGLADARRKAAEARRLRAEGVDPIEAREAERAKAALEAARAITFKKAAEQYIEAHRAGWRNAKHADQWSSTLETYAYPVLGSLPVQDIDVPLVLKVLEPIWKTKTETASRVRGRIEAVLDWATVRGYRHGDNPARWRGLLENVLPQRSKVQRVEHHPALPYAEIGAFVAALRKQEGISARALEFAILTAARTGEVIGTRWGEFDLAEKAWTIPAERMKAGREHRIPLAPRALEILAAVKPLAQVPRSQAEAEAFVFPGGRRGKPLSNMAMLKLLERMGRDDLTAHGFRSTFRDWAAERTSYPREVAEMALAHSVGDKAEAAYRRGDLFEKRRRLMNEWARFCGTIAAAKTATVTKLHAARV